MGVKLISVSLSRVGQFAEQVSMSNVKFRDIFRFIIQFECLQLKVLDV